MIKPTLLILAAGIGSRYGGFKQIDPLGPGGEISLDYALFDAWRAGFGRAVFVIRPELEAPIREHFGDRLRGRLETAFVFQSMDDLPAGFTPPAERKKPWGTGHAIRAAIRSCDITITPLTDTPTPATRWTVRQMQLRWGAVRARACCSRGAVSRGSSRPTGARRSRG